MTYTIGPRDSPAVSRDQAALLVIAPTARELGTRQRAPEVRKAVVGIGANSAQRFAALLQELKPSSVLSLGFAGALKPGLRTGTLTLHRMVLADEKSLAQFTCLSGLSERVRSALAGMEVAEGPLLTVPRPLLTPEAKLSHGVAHQAIAVDMEGYWLAEAAAERDIPMIAVRVILDEAGHRLPGMVADIVADEGRNEWLHAARALRH
ncbi:MAG: hypothetical protein WD645_04295, partial [Dehalococcoidia bacterium]